VWIIYLAAGQKALAWTAFIILLPVALLGFTMFARWIGIYRGGAGTSPSPAATPAGRAASPAWQARGSSRVTTT
jgi:hypothetical protein